MEFIKAQLQNYAVSNMLSNNGCSGLLHNTNADATAAPTHKPKHT